MWIQMWIQTPQNFLGHIFLDNKRFHSWQLSPNNQKSAPQEYKCNFCGKQLPIVKGVYVHVSQQHACWEALQRVVASKYSLAKDELKNLDSIQPSADGTEGGIDPSMLFNQNVNQPNKDVGGSPNWRACVEEVKRWENTQDGLRTIQEMLERSNQRVRIILNVGERHRKRMDMNLGHHSKI